MFLTEKKHTKNNKHKKHVFIQKNTFLTTMLASTVEMCGNDFRVPIPPHSHDSVPIPIPGLEKS